MQARKLNYESNLYIKTYNNQYIQLQETLYTVLFIKYTNTVHIPLNSKYDIITAKVRLFDNTIISLIAYCNLLFQIDKSTKGVEYCAIFRMYPEDIYKLTKYPDMYDIRMIKQERFKNNNRKPYSPKAGFT